jgi:hypothetical protein
VDTQESTEENNETLDRGRSAAMEKVPRKRPMRLIDLAQVAPSALRDVHSRGRYPGVGIYFCRELCISLSYEMIR